MRSRVIGRLIAEPAGDLKAGTLLTEQLVERLLTAGVTALRVRSPLTCQAEYGICYHCYGQEGSGDWQAGNMRRCRWDYRWTIHRRTGDATNHAHIP